MREPIHRGDPYVTVWTLAVCFTLTLNDREREGEREGEGERREAHREALRGNSSGLLG